MASLVLFGGTGQIMLWAGFLGCCLKAWEYESNPQRFYIGMVL